MQDIQSLLAAKLEQHKKRQEKVDPLKQALQDRYGDDVTLHSHKNGNLVLICNSAPLASNIQLENYQLKEELGVKSIRVRIIN